MRKKIFSVYLFLLVVVVTGCETQHKFELYENKVIACCGVSNPTENLEWLKTLINENPSYSALSVKLYQDNADNTLNIVIVDNIFTSVYNCNGEIQFVGHDYGATNVPKDKSNIPSVSPAPCSQCEEFYNTHHFVGLIYEKKIVE